MSISRSYLSAEAAWKILSSIPSYVDAVAVDAVGGTIYSPEGAMILGYVTNDVYNLLRKKKNATTIADDTILFHKDHRKYFKKEIQSFSIPEGSIVFPEENFIIVTPDNSNRKERDKLLKRVLMGYTDFTVEDGAIFAKGHGSYYMIPVIEISTVPVLKWAVCPNHNKAKYAWIFDDLGDAAAKMIDLENNT